MLEILLAYIMAYFSILKVPLKRPRQTPKGNYLSFFTPYTMLKILLAYNMAYFSILKVPPKKTEGDPEGELFILFYS